MAAYKIYHKDGSVLTDYNGKEISVHSLEYNGTWMGECFVTVTFENEAPIDFSIGDYITYRNERFEINYDPGKIKCSSKNSYGGAFRYDDVKFNALSDELVRCDMLDLVLYDNKLHYTALPQFSFYVESVDDLLDRIQANLDELYGEAAWKIYSRNKQRSLQRGGLEAEWVDIYGEDVTDNIIDSTSISINDQTCWDALSLVNSQFDINFVIRNRNIYVGTAGRPTSKIFKYGKDNGLYEIEQNSESDQAIVTRLRAYGSNRNLPNRYYADLGAIPFLNITGDYHDGSTENGLSVLMEDSVYAGMFTDIVYDNGSNTKHCRIKGRVDGYEFDGTLELVKKDATKSTTRLLVDGKAVSDAIKAKIDAGFVQVDFLSGANRSKFGGSRISYVSNLPNNMACDRLMLPGFPNETLQEWWNRQTEEKKLWLNPGGKDHIFSSDSHRPYVESLNIEKIGIRPSSVFFEQDDKVNGIIEIYPTIEEMEIDGVRIDEIYTGTSVDDDGRFGDGESVANVNVILSPKINFDIRALMQDDFTLCMKDGMCAGREFKVASCTKQEDGSWKLLIERSEDSGLALYFPYKDFQINKGDHFVLTGIELPDAYVEAASEKLLKYCIAYLDKNDYTRYVYQPKVDEIFMARQHDTAMSDSTGLTKSLYLTLKEGDIMLFKDEDLGIDAEITIDQLIIKEEEGKIPTYDITLREDKEVGTIQKIQNQISSMVSGNGGFAGGSSYTPSQIKDIVNSIGSDRFLSKLNPDTAQGLITFIQGLVSEGKITAKQGVEIGTFVTGLIGGSGARIDKGGNGEMESLVIRQFLEVPELRFNRIDVVSGELWNSICFGTIEAVDTKKRIVTLKLQDGELSGIEVGDICRGVFHCLESSNPTADMAEDECGFQQMAGFSTSYFTPTEVYDDGARFKYSLRSGTSVHPQVGMKFAVYGSFTNPARRASAYHTRTYMRYLNAVDTWRISPDKNIYGQQGNLEGLTINEMEMHGYGGYFHNIYMSGVHVEFDRDWLDHNLPKVYSVHLTTYEHTIVTDIEDNPLNGLEELRNVITGESNVMSGGDNVIATRLAVTTTILAHKGTTPLLFSDTMDEGRFIVTLACVGCTAEVDNGVVKVTSIDKESAEHRVDISVNCEGEGVYVQTFNIPVVKQGENGITADLDNEMASIAANDKGEPLVVPFEEIVSHGRMWYGNEPMYLTSAEVAVPGGITVADVTTITDSEGQHNYLPIDSEHKQCALRITKVDASAADTNEIRISLTGRVKQELNTEYSKTVVFKLNKVRMGENALNYQLLPSVTEIKATAEGVLSESAISCGVTASDGKSLTQLSSLSGTGLSMSYVVYYSANSWSSEKSYTINDNLSLSGLGITKDSVRIVFYLKWNDVLIDKEGVPVVANGEKGDEGNGISSIETYWNIGTKNIYSSSSFYYGTWQTSSPAVNYDYPFLWKKTITHFTKASSKTTYECVGKIGDKGIDGNGTEWIYYLNNSETFDGNDPSAWAASQEDDYIKSGTGWTDDPTGVSATKRFEWIAKRSKTNGTWGKFTPPHIWAKYGEKGEQGKPGTPGEPGADATSYWLDIEVTHVGLSASGSWSPSLIGMYVRKKKGDEAVSNCYDFYVSAWGYDGSSYTLVKAGSKSSYFYFSTSDAGKYSAFVIVLSSNDPSSVGYSSLTIVDRETITITTEKAVGSVLVDRGVFSSGNTYSWKYDNDRKCWMRDMVLYKASDGNYYRYAIKSMGQEGVTSYPSSTSYWEQLSTYKTIITDCLYTDNATIGGFYVNASQFWSANNNLTLDGKNGNITISGKLKATDAEITGQITATSGTFDNCTIKDTCTITKIDAVKGTIGGMTISNNSISSTVNGSMILSSEGLSCNYNNAYMYSGIINFIDISNGNVSKTSASIEIGNSTTGLQAMINLTNTFAMFKVPIYLPSLPKYAAAKSGQLCVGDGDQHIYLKP